MLSQQTTNLERKDTQSWSQINNTIKLLTVSIAQISLSLSSGDKSVDVVGHAFEELLSQIEKIGNELATEGEIKTNEIKILCDEAASQTKNFIFAFQFYDELSQRLNHVADGLSGLSELIQDDRRFDQLTEWKLLHQHIKANYSIQDEIEMFDCVMAGMSIEEVKNKLLASRMVAEQVENEVELF